MAEINEKVTNMVRRELKKPDPVDNEALYEKAVKISPDIQDINMRQFHARYTLQVKREMSSADPNREKKPRKPRKRKVAPEQYEQRERLRTAFLAFGKELVDADKKQVYDVIHRIDHFIDQAMATT
jgi:hypothetical protein